MLSHSRIEHLTGKIIKLLWNSENVEEIYASNRTLQLKINAIFEEYCNLDDVLEEEADRRLKHLQKGTQDWEIEFEKLSEEVRRKKGI